MQPYTNDEILPQWVASPTDGTPRLDVLLTRRYPTVTRREIVEWITTGKVTVNGKRAKKGLRIAAGDVVSVLTSPLLSPNPHLPIRILFVDDAIVILDKPSGVASVALRSEDTQTAANFLLAHFPETKDVSPRPLDAGLVHRLDTATSGLLLTARTPSAYMTLRQQFTQHLIEKRYLALIRGNLRISGQRCSSLAPTGPHRRLMHEVSTTQGQYAHTAYAPVTQLPQHTLIQAVIPTGVRHQIRVHLAALGYPIVGDPLYGDTTEAERLCLHAEALEFVHPTTKKQVRFTCPLPEDFRTIQHRLMACAHRMPE